MPLRRVPWRYVQQYALASLERRFLRNIEGATAYLWSELSVELARELHLRGIRVVREKFNCHKAYARAILDRVYSKLGVPAPHGITDERIAKEREELQLADFVFSPSPCVRASLIAEGVSPAKILDSSYGWSPTRFAHAAPSLSPCDGVTVLFAGAICVRKGAHILLDAWSRARVRGRLVLVGQMEPTIAEVCRETLLREDVVVVPFTPNVGGVFKSADYFVFPSLEEGSPLVTYEACSVGLPAIVTDMGAGGVVRNGIEGIQVESGDVESLADAIHRLAESEDLRRDYGSAATQRAREFTWDRVGSARREALLAQLATPKQPARV
ncbi:MAG: glycosyltransferase family 4 protein [Phycisphaerales bacterium]